MKKYVNKYFLLFYYVIMSILFTLESVIYIGDSGDQTWFAMAADKFGFFEFAIYRYLTWSNRLLIESVTMIMSKHELLFILTVFISVILFFYCFNELFIPKTTSWKLKLLPPLLFLSIFPSFFFTGAGLVATVTNYLFPMISLILAWYLIDKGKKIISALSLPFLLYTCMQEQFAIFVFVLFFYLFAKDYLLKKKIKKTAIYCVFVSILGIISTLISPGTDIRLAAEIQNWYPGFNQMSLLTKVIKGYLETNRVLFVTSEINVVFLFLIVIIITSILRHRYLSTCLTGVVFYNIVVEHWGITNLFTAVQRTIDDQNERGFSFQENFYPLVLYTLILIFLLISVFYLFKDCRKGWLSIIILVAGYAGRMLVSLSPTIYASGLRTYTPLMFSVLIIIVLLICESYQELHTKNILSLRRDGRC